MEFEISIEQSRVDLVLAGLKCLQRKQPRKSPLFFII